MKTSNILKLFLVIAIVVLIGNTLAISRDYQDSWVLEGLEIPFALFVITYVAAFFSEKRTSVTIASLRDYIYMVKRLRETSRFSTLPSARIAVT